MGGVNQLLYLARRVTRGGARKVVEIGSKDYGSTVPWRDHFTKAQYIGVDLEPGPGVDVVANIEDGTGDLPTNADVVICCSVLEHVRRPWVAAANLERLLKPGGVLYVATPWVWRYHPYPDDYWRFTFNGIRELFPSIDWIDQSYSTNLKDDFFPAERYSDNARALVNDGLKFLPYMELHSLGVRQ